jgi:hypothetical protein
MIKSQTTREKTRRADHVVWNNSDRAMLAEQAISGGTLARAVMDEKLELSAPERKTGPKQAARTRAGHRSGVTTPPLSLDLNELQECSERN